MPCTFDPQNISNFTRTADSDAGITAVADTSVAARPFLVVDDDTAGKAVFVCGDPNLPDPYALEIEFGADLSAGVLEDLGNQIFDSGVRVGFTAGNLAYQACLIKRGGVEVVALRTATGFTNGLAAPWSTGDVVCRLRRSSNTAILEVAGATEQTTNLGPDVNAGVQFGTYSGAARVRARFVRIASPAAGAATGLALQVKKIEIGGDRWDPTEPQDEVEAGVKVKASVTLDDGSDPDPMTVPITMHLLSNGTAIWPPAAVTMPISGGFVHEQKVENGITEDEWKRDQDDLKMEFEKKAGQPWEFGVKHKHFGMPPADYPTLTFRLKLGAYEGEATVSLVREAHGDKVKWKYKAPNA